MIHFLLAAYFFIGPIPMDQNPFQSNVMVRGTVVDGRGRGIGGAKVYATSLVDDRAALTDSEGRFYFLTLLPGDYTFSASRTGYSTCNVQDNEAQELDAGFEYLATVTLLNACL